MGRPANTQYAVAVHLLTLLASRPGQPQSSEQMAVSIRANPVHIRRVLGLLRRAGIVESRPGPHGGWRLHGDPAQLPLGEVWRVVNAAEHVLGLHDPNPECPVGCLIRTAMTALDQRASDAVITELDQTTVADLAAQAQQHPAATDTTSGPAGPVGGNPLRTSGPAAPSAPTTTGERRCQ